MGAINLPVYYYASVHDDFYENYRVRLEEAEHIFQGIEDEILGYYKSAKFSEF